MMRTFGKRFAIRTACGMAFADICRQIERPKSPAQDHAGYDLGSSSQSACSDMVLPKVKRRMPVRPFLRQEAMRSGASEASTSTENTPVKRSGFAATASATYELS